MAGTLTVQTLQGPSSGANANKLLIPSGQTLDVSGGTLVPSAGQIIKRSPVTYFYTQEGTSSLSFVDATGASVSFACDYANSLVQINVVAMVGGKGSLRVLADSTVVTNSLDAYNYYDGTTSQTSWTNGSVRRMIVEKHFYTPATTNSITYKLQYRAYSTGGSNEFGLNELHNSASRKYSHIEVLEIAQ